MPPKATTTPTGVPSYIGWPCASYPITGPGPTRLIRAVTCQSRIRATLRPPANETPVRTTVVSSPNTKARSTRSPTEDDVVTTPAGPAWVSEAWASCITVLGDDDSG